MYGAEFDLAKLLWPGLSESGHVFLGKTTISPEPVQESAPNFTHTTLTHASRCTVKLNSITPPEPTLRPIEYGICPNYGHYFSSQGKNWSHKWPYLPIRCRNQHHLLPTQIKHIRAGVHAKNIKSLNRNRCYCPFTSNFFQYRQSSIFAEDLSGVKGKCDALAGYLHDICSHEPNGHI